MTAPADPSAGTVCRWWQSGLRRIVELAPCALFAAVVASCGALVATADAGPLELIGSLVALTTSGGLLVLWVLTEDRRSRSNTNGTALVPLPAAYDWSDLDLNIPLTTASATRAFELLEVARQLPTSPLGETEALLDDGSVSPENLASGS